MQVNMHDAKARLSELVAAAERGEEIVIARNGVPIVRLARVQKGHPPVLFDRLAGQIKVGEDFDDPLPDFADYL